MEKISVIVPIYNSEKYLHVCVDSIQKQSFSNLEIILIDDGSLDGSGKICDRFAEEDNRIIVIHKKNEGVSAARNDGLKLATGDWISFVDSDDELENDMYEFLIKLARESNAQIVHCGYKRISEEGIILKEVSGTHKIIVQKPVEAIDNMLEGRFFVGGLWNKLFSKKCLQNLQFAVQLKNNEDILFNALAFQNAKLITFADETKYKYYEHSTSACNRLSQERQLRDAVLAASQLCVNSSNEEILAIARKWLFSTNLRLYRYFLFNQNQSKQERDNLKRWLKENYKSINLSRREKSNYCLLANCGCIYKIIYRIYNFVRKPNWDVKKNQL